MTIVLPFTTVTKELDPSALRRAFGAFPSGVVAVAAEVDGRHVGMAASSFTSVSLEPALVSFCIANQSATWPLLRRARRLGVSVLADHQGDVCRQLSGPAADRFTGLDLLHTDEGAVLLHDAVAGFDTSIFREVQAGDHTVVLLRLHAATHSDDGSPLVFHRSSFGRLAG